MKKILLALTILFLAPLTVSAYEIQTSFDQEKCELTVTGTMDGHEASVSYYDPSSNVNNGFVGMKTGTITNGSYEVKFVLKYEQDTTINIVAVNEKSENHTEKTNEVIPACSIEHQDEPGTPDDPNPPEQNDNHIVSFNTDGGTVIQNVEIPDGNTVQRPEQDPEKDGFTFGGWYEDPTFEHPFDFGMEIHDDKEIYARWIDNDDLVRYDLEDPTTGNIVSFMEEEGLDFSLTLIDIMSLTPEQFETIFEMPAELYDTFKEMISEGVKSTGSMLAIYAIQITRPTSTPGDDQELHDGPFTIKIKLTEEMKKLDSFKLTYIDIDENGELIVGETITLTVEGDYLVGTLPHLSAYVLTGTKTEAPKTNDNIMHYVNILAISMIGLSLSTYLVIRRKKHN